MKYTKSRMSLTNKFDIGERLLREKINTEQPFGEYIIHAINQSSNWKNTSKYEFIYNLEIIIYSTEYPTDGYHQVLQQICDKHYLTLTNVVFVNSSSERYVLKCDISTNNVIRMKYDIAIIYLHLLFTRKLLSIGESKILLILHEYLF